MKVRRAFTLMEIMVVVAIVIILVGIAIPNILRSRVAANEAAAMANLKAVGNSCQAYHIDQQSYPNSLLDLSTSNPPYIDNVLGSGEKQGYEFIYESTDADHFTIHANPIHTGLLKGRYFYLDESGTIRFKIDEPASINDEIVV